jgi:hypothetical protein
LHLKQVPDNLVKKGYTLFSSIYHLQNRCRLAHKPRVVASTCSAGSESPIKPNASRLAKESRRDPLGQGGVMPFFQFGWRVIVPVVAVIAVLNIGAVSFVREAYPSDPFKSQALAKCVASDPGFVRFFSDDRSRCYARQPRQTGLVSPMTADLSKN